MSEEISSEEIAALLARESMSKEMTDDAISRRAAIEKIYWLGLDHDTAIMCDLAIRALPSVIPSRPTELSEDAISRQAALKLFFVDDTEYTGSEICNMIHELPSVNLQEPKTDVLDKIRAEIEERKKNSGGEPNRDIAFNVCLRIIDKYKAESEEV